MTPALETLARSLIDLSDAIPVRPVRWVFASAGVALYRVVDGGKG